jgi:hypothetical protein
VRLLSRGYVVESDAAAKVKHTLIRATANL